MKSLSEFINEEMINESAAANLQNPRKGSYVYILKYGEEKAIKVKIIDVARMKTKEYTRIEVILEENPNIINWWEEYVFPGIKYDLEKYQCKAIRQGGEAYYIGTSIDAINNYIDTKIGYELDEINRKIDDAQSKLDELIKAKQEREAKLLNKIHESATEE